MFAKVGDIGMEGDILSPFSITSDLATHFVGQRVILYPRLPSTMEVAREEALRGAAEGTVVIAEEQTAGKGRMGRIWLSPKGCVALSVILYPKRGLLPSLVMVASLAVVHAITAVTGLQSQIKWPNDVLINGRKVCGIIIESSAGDNGINYAVVGIGINVNLKTTEFTEIASVATSLSDELGREVSRLSLIKRLLVEIEPLYLSAKNSDAVYQEWRDSLVTLGRKVCARSGNDIYEGIAESVEKDGSLILRLRDGSLKRIVAGDVTLIR
jgi:BirA family biotin operon repressor/biotin-[acetyl-CoA-carboxylase] ligase